MAVYIIYAQRFEGDDEQDYEKVYVGTDKEEAHETEVEGYTALHMQIWTNNILFVEKESRSNEMWETTFSLPQKTSEEIAKLKKNLETEEAKMREIRLLAEKGGIV